MTTASPPGTLEDTHRQLIALLRAQVHQDAEGWQALASVDEPGLLIHEAVRLLAAVIAADNRGHVDEAIDALGRDLLRAAP